MSETVRSFGTVPVLQSTKGLKFLIINMYGSAGGTHWAFPKGRPEPGETPLQSALRETKEEVDVIPEKVIEEKVFEQHYRFQINERKIDKTVMYFIAYVRDERIQIQEEEVKEAKWLEYEAARKLLTHENTKLILDQVYEYVLEHDHT